MITTCYHILCIWRLGQKCIWTCSSVRRNLIMDLDLFMTSFAKHPSEVHIQCTCSQSLVFLSTHFDIHVEQKQFITLLAELSETELVHKCTAVHYYSNVHCTFLHVHLYIYCLHSKFV